MKFGTFWHKIFPHRFCNFQITDSQNVFRQMSKKPRSREPFDKQHGKRPQALLKSASQQLYHIHWSLPSQLSWKLSVSLTCQILGLLFNTLRPDKMYPVLNRDNLTIPIQMQLSQKQKSFAQILDQFLVFILNFKYFETKYDPHRFCISEIRDFENVVR